MKGSDHEFIVNIYRRILLRVPDEGGYRHYRDLVEADPGCRRRIIEGMAGSTEASRQGEEIYLIWDDAEAVSATIAAPAMPELTAEELLTLLRQRLRTLDAAGLAALEAPLLECLEALRAERLMPQEPGA
ncbi:MAG: DUF4214 domain-containing protein [Roseomonas sp.]|nr:DUF4214 domain-containing protein [Roseomonas sp.]